MWISLIPAAFIGYWFYYPGDEPYLLQSIWNMELWAIFILTPIIIALMYISTVIWAAIITKIRIGYLNMRRKPREGVFKRDKNDKDYLYWNKRNFARMFLFWLLHSTPFTFMKTYFSYKFFGVKIGENSVINHIWMSPEFVSIGDNVKIGQGSCIYSFMFEHDKLLVAEVGIEDNVLVGPQCVFLPGTKIEKGVTVDAGAFSHPFSTLEEGETYKGTPVKKIGKAKGNGRNKDKKDGRNKDKK